MASSNPIGPKLRYASPLTIAITVHQTPVQGFACCALLCDSGDICLGSHKPCTEQPGPMPRYRFNVRTILMSHTALPNSLAPKEDTRFMGDFNNRQIVAVGHRARVDTTHYADQIYGNPGVIQYERVNNLGKPGCTLQL